MGMGSKKETVIEKPITKIEPSTEQRNYASKGGRVSKGDVEDPKTKRVLKPTSTGLK